MDRRLKYWELAGFAWTAGAGCVALRARLEGWPAALRAADGSVWALMWTLFLALLAFTLAQVWFTGRSYPNFAAVRAVSALTGTALAPVIVYTVSGAAGGPLPGLAEAALSAAAAAAFLLDFRLLRRGSFLGAVRQALGALALLGLLCGLLWGGVHPLPPGLLRPL